MFTIKKLKAPEPLMRSLPSQKSILIKVPKNFALRKTNTKKIVFSDERGKPLAEIRDIPWDESHHETRSQRVSETVIHPPTNTVTWGLLPVKNARKPLEGALEMGKIEEKRLEEESVSRAPLFGIFNAFEPPHLADLTRIHSDDLIPLIPLVPEISKASEVEKIPQLPQTPSQMTYKQVFENNVDQQIPPQMPLQIHLQMPVNAPATAPSPAILNLVAQLKERGLVPTGQPSTSNNVPPMPEQRRPSRFSQGTPGRGVCTHHIRNPRGCYHGANCRFEHDDAQREAFQRGNRNRPRGDPWRQRPHNNGPFRGSRDGHRRFDRSRSPQPDA